jgi:hypothetical protein
MDWSMSMSHWNKIPDAPEPGQRKLPYIAPGDYRRLTVQRVAEVRSEKPHQRGKLFFAVDLTVEESDTDLREVAWVVDLSRGDMSYSDVKGFVRALLPDAEIDGALMERLVGEEQPGVGLAVAAYAEKRKTQAGNDFTKVFWRPVEA